MCRGAAYPTSCDARSSGATIDGEVACPVPQASNCRQCVACQPNQPPKLLLSLERDDRPSYLCVAPGMSINMLVEAADPDFWDSLEASACNATFIMRLSCQHTTMVRSQPRP